VDVARLRDAWIWRWKVTNGIPLEDSVVHDRDDLAKFLPPGVLGEVTHG